MNFDRTSYIKQPISIEKELKVLFHVSDSLTIFEIGACEGEDSIKYARLFINSKIYAFEPLPDNIVLIQNNLLHYDVRNVSYYNMALSSKNGISEFYVSEGRPEDAVVSDWNYGNKSSSLLAPARHLEIVNFIRFNKKIDVETITLDSFCKNNNIRGIDFIHMDVQGAELMVLEGASNLLSFIKVIWLEVSKVDLYKNQPLEKDINAFMTDHNFVLIKDTVNQLQGDQLYISKTFYPNYKTLFPPPGKLALLIHEAKIQLKRITRKFRRPD